MTRRALILAATLMLAAPSYAQDVPYCGDEGVWIQILGSGGPDLDDRRSAASYVVWVDDKARALVDVGSGTALRLDEAGVAVEDLDAVLLTNLEPHATADLVSLLEGSIGSERESPLPIFGPSSGDGSVSTSGFFERLIGAEGAYPQLADFLTFRSRGYKVSVRDVVAEGNRRWSRYRTDDIVYSAIPVNYGDTLALAWRVDIGEFSIAFAGDFNNAKDVVARFAEGVDALVVSHAIPESSRGAMRDRFATPSQLARIAARADARMMVLGHRTVRTTGLESISRAAIEEHYDGPLVFANELECWGL